MGGFARFRELGTHPRKRQCAARMPRLSLVAIGSSRNAKMAASLIGVKLASLRKLRNFIVAHVKLSWASKRQMYAARKFSAASIFANNQ
jgi:hypothetical protein